MGVLFVGILAAGLNYAANSAIDLGLVAAPRPIDLGAATVSPALVVGLGALAVSFIISYMTSGKRQPRVGAVFITGCDSGMGEATALHFAGIGFHVYAACLFKDSEKKLLEKVKQKHGTTEKVTFVQLDVTSDESVQSAFDLVSATLGEKSPGVNGLVGVINCAGIAVTGPIEYLPIDMYKRQLDVNFFGYIRVAQKFLPLLRKTVENPQARRGRVVFIGTGGGVITPTPGLLSAYMSSKWAGEAFIQVLRAEMALQKKRIDSCMLNPGVVKPTGLADGGRAIMEKFFASVDPKAKDEYKWLFDRFDDFNAEQPGSHPHNVALAMEEIMTTPFPQINYCVGFDSKAANFLGYLPSSFTEWLYRAAIFKETSFSRA